MANLRFFDALPAYYGGKRKLVKEIFKLAPPASDAPVFADAFMGGGSVSVMAKALGYKVMGNDIAERSYIVGKGLVENNRVKIASEDINRLFVESSNYRFIQDKFSPQVFLSKHAVFLDNAMAVVWGMEDGPKKHLSLLLLIKMVFYLRPYSKFSSPNAFNIPMEQRQIESIKNRTYHASIKAALRPVPDILKDLAAAINTGIIDNAQENRVFRMDVREFLRQTKADVVYFDPPYAGTLAYEEENNVLDQILTRQTTIEKSEFSRKDGIIFLAEVFQAARHIPVWIISMGNAGGTNNCFDELVENIGQHRDVQAKRIKYKHMTGAASEEHKAKNEEYLILGRPK
jgi:site-specific DNA-adenine methylase